MTAESGPLESVVESLPNSSQPGMRPSYIREVPNVLEQLG